MDDRLTFGGLCVDANILTSSAPKKTKLAPESWIQALSWHRTGSCGLQQPIVAAGKQVSGGKKLSCTGACAMGPNEISTRTGIQ